MNDPNFRYRHGSYLLAQLHVDLSGGRVGLVRFVIATERDPRGKSAGTVFAEIAHVESTSAVEAKHRLSSGFDPYVSTLARLAHTEGIVTP